MRIIPLVVALFVSVASAAAQNVVTLAPATRFQTMVGWEATTFVSNSLPFQASFKASWPNFQGPLLDNAVADGINRLRLEIRSGTENIVDYWSQFNAGQLSDPLWRCYRYATVNDNGNPSAINQSGFQWAELDWKMDNVVVPLRTRLEARGEALYVNLVYVAFTAQIVGTGCPAGLTYDHVAEAEYAEFMLAVFQHLQTRYGFVPDAVDVILEPDNTSQWRGTEIGNAIVAASVRLASAGFTPTFIAPSTTNMANTAGYFDALAATGAAAKVRELSYHRYGGYTAQVLADIVSRATANGIGAFMSEWWSSANGYQTLHQDLKDGRNTSWSWGALAGFGPTDMYRVNAADPSHPALTLTANTAYVRRYFQHVRRGAVRYHASSTTTAVDPLAFVNRDGTNVVVATTTGPVSFIISGLPTGTYGVSCTTAAGDQAAPDQTVSSGASLSLSMPDAGVIVIYGKSTSPRPATHVLIR